MSNCQRNVDDILKKRIETQQKKRRNLHLHRQRLKRKRSLASHLSFTSTLTLNEDQSTETNNYSTRNQCSLSLNDNVSLIASELETASISHKTNSDSNDGSDVSIDDETASSSSNDHSCDECDDVEQNCNFSIMPDERQLHSLTKLTVHQFSIDILEFYRSSRLANSQRNQLLRLFEKYLPSPNLVPKSSEDLSSKTFSCNFILIR